MNLKDKLIKMLKGQPHWNSDVDTNFELIADEIEDIKSSPVTPSIPNPNLLINGDFKINQREQDVYILESSEYSVDRFSTINRATNIELTDKGVLVKPAHDWGCFGQFISMDELNLKGKTLTASISLYDVKSQIPSESLFRAYYVKDGQHMMNVINTQTLARINYTEPGVYHITFTVPEDAAFLCIYAHVKQETDDGSDTYFGVEWMKLEYGEVATPFIHKSKGEELLECQRYFQKIVTTNNPDYVTDMHLHFYHRFLVPMRIESPTIKIIDNRLFIGTSSLGQNDVIDKFICDVIISREYHISYRFTKNDDELTIQNTNRISNHIWMEVDAEIR